MRPLHTIALIATLAVGALTSSTHATAGPPPPIGVQSLSQLERDGALPILLGSEAAIQTELGAQSPVLLYRFDAVAGRTYVFETFDVRRGPGRGTVLAAYDSAGTYLRSSMGGYGNVNQVLMMTAPQSDGPLYLRVSGREGWAGGFGLRVLARFDQPGAAWGEAMEPNDYCELAAPLSVGATPQTQGIGYVGPEIITSYPDGDSYRIAVEAGRRYEVLVDGLPPSSPEGAVGVHFHEIETGEFIGRGARSRAGGAPVSVAHRAKESGTLCVRVTAGMRPAPWYGPYTIQVCDGSCRRSIFLPVLKGVASG